MLTNYHRAQVRDTYSIVPQWSLSPLITANANDAIDQSKIKTKEKCSRSYARENTLRPEGFGFDKITIA